MYTREAPYGGTCIYTRHPWTEINERIDLVNLSEEKVFECAAIEIKCYQMIVLCIYRSPNSCIKTFMTKLEQAITKISRENDKKTILITGDFNINTMVDNHATQDLETLLKSYNLHLLIDEPTRITNQTEACIDNVITNLHVNYVNCKVEESGLSDHKSITIHMKMKGILPKNVNEVTGVTYKRVFNKINDQKMVTEISEQSWEGMEKGNNLDEKVEIFANIFNSCFNKAYPLKKIKLRPLKLAKWITKGIIISCRHKRNIIKIGKETNSEIWHKHVQNYAKCLKMVINTAKKRQINDEISKSENKNKAVWNIINKETGRVKKTNNSIRLVIGGIALNKAKEVANGLNKYFINNITNTKNLGLYQTDPKKALSQTGLACPRSMFLFPVTETELKLIVDKLKNKTSSGLDEIPITVIKKCINYLIKPLTELINESLTTGHFPKLYKKGKIIPIYKKGDHNDPNNYRPVQLLSSFSKIYEKVVFNRLTNFLEKNNILVDEQHGFRKYKSTETAIFEYIGQITNALSQGKYAAGILCDLSKAFDSVNHEILLGKLHHYGVRGTPNKWLRSYLENRKQQVVIREKNTKNLIKNYLSEEGIIERGVPQGGILAPLLFLIYINDMPGHLKNGDSTIFADDTSILITGNSEIEINEKANKTMEELNNWLANNELKLNANKTHVMLFKTRGNARPIETKVRVGNETLKITEQISFLGIELDCDLNWKGHIKKLQSKLAKQNYTIRTLRTIASMTTLKIIYHGLFEAHMSYGIIFWGNSMHGKKIFALQKRVIRAIVRIDRRKSCRTHFKNLKILTFPSLYLFKLLFFIKTNSNQFPVYNHNYQTRNKGNFDIKTENRAQIINQAKQQGLTIFNMLPDNLKTMVEHKFKSELRNILMENEFYSVDEFLKFFKTTGTNVLCNPSIK
jgi:hypothetical protein